VTPVTGAAGLRKAARTPRHSDEDRLKRLEQHCAELLAEFESLVVHRQFHRELEAMIEDLKTGLNIVDIRIPAA
jgi:hypothetical protein